MKRAMVVILAFVLSLTALAGCGGAKSVAGMDTKEMAPDVKAIYDRGKLRAGVKVDVPKFGYKDPKTEKIDGFEIDLVRAIARKIFGDDGKIDNKIELTGVNAKTRGPALDNGEIDLVAATFTINDERKKSWNFTDAYFQDNVGIMVKSNAGIKSLKDLNGKKIGVATGATSRTALQAEADKLGVKVEFSEFTTYPEIKAALDADRVSAFSVDGSILAGYLDKNTMLLPEKFSPQNYGIATKKGNDGFAKLVNDTLAAMKQNGEMDKILKKWGLK